MFASKCNGGSNFYPRQANAKQQVTGRGRERDLTNRCRHGGHEERGRDSKKGREREESEHRVRGDT